MTSFENGMTFVEAEIGLLDAPAIIVEDDEMDAPSDWDAGTVCFDPYI